MSPVPPLPVNPRLQHQSLLERSLEDGDDFNIADIEEQESEISQMADQLFDRSGIDFERPYSAPVSEPS